jgi:hypothetical protein
VVDCYDNDEFIRFQLAPGSPLVDSIQICTALRSTPGRSRAGS